MLLRMSLLMSTRTATNNNILFKDLYSTYLNFDILGRVQSIFYSEAYFNKVKIFGYSRVQIILKNTFHVRVSIFYVNNGSLFNFSRNPIRAISRAYHSNSPKVGLFFSKTNASFYLQDFYLTNFYKFIFHSYKNECNHNLYDGFWWYNVMLIFLEVGDTSRAYNLCR